MPRKLLIPIRPQCNFVGLLAKGMGGNERWTFFYINKWFNFDLKCFERRRTCGNFGELARRFGHLRGTGYQPRSQNPGIPLTKSISAQKKNSFYLLSTENVNGGLCISPPSPIHHLIPRVISCAQLHTSVDIYLMYCYHSFIEPGIY